MKPVSLILALASLLLISFWAEAPQAQSAPAKQLFIVNVGNQTCGNSVQRITQISSFCKFTVNGWEKIVDNGDGTVSLIAGCDSCDGPCASRTNYTLSTGPSGQCSRDEQGNYIKYFFDETSFTYYYPGIPVGTTIFTVSSQGRPCRMDAAFEYVTPGVCVNGSRFECDESLARRISCETGVLLNVTSFDACLAPGFGPVFTCYGYGSFRYYGPNAAPPSSSPSGAPTTTTTPTPSPVRPPVPVPAGDTRCSRMATLDAAYLLDPIPRDVNSICSWPRFNSPQCCAAGMTRDSLPQFRLRKHIIGEGTQACHEAMDWFDCAGCDQEATRWIRASYSGFVPPPGKLVIEYCSTTPQVLWDRCADVPFNISGTVKTLKEHVPNRADLVWHPLVSYDKYLSLGIHDGKTPSCYSAGDAPSIVFMASPIVMFGICIIALFVLLAV